MAKYSGDNIKTFDNDTDKVRLKPSMYLGPKGNAMALAMAREVFDNCVDEHMAGRNDAIHILLDTKQQRVVIADEGNGIPTEMRKVRGESMSTLTAVFTQLQAGGKFDDKAYDRSRGTHGVGVTATNALSAELTVWSFYRGKCVSQTFKQGKPRTKLVAAKMPKLGLKLKPKGTVVSFVPDTSVIGKGAVVVPAELAKLADQTAYMNPKLTITITVVGAKGTKTAVYRHKGGLGDYLKHQIDKLEVGALGKPCIINTPSFDLAFQWTDHDEEAFVGHTNSLPNVDGGVHVDAFYRNTHKALCSMMLSKDKPFTVSNLRDGLIGLIDWKLSHPEFSSQTKEKLVDHRVKEGEPELLKQLTKFFGANKSLARQIIQRAGELKALMEEQLKDKRALKALKTTRNDSRLPPSTKLTTANVKPEYRELYIVEGDSAGGTAKYARLQHQEVLKLRGKILNVMRDKANKAFDSEEVINVLRSIGFDPNKKDPFAELRIGKVILLCDPDPDGHHINTLLLALMTKYLKPMFDRGMVFVAAAKEYTAVYGGKRYFADSSEALLKQLPKGAKADVRHIKGWGEVNQDVLRDLAFEPSKRKLIKLKPLDSASMKRFGLLMQEDTAYRRKLLNINGGDK